MEWYQHSRPPGPPQGYWPGCADVTSLADALFTTTQQRVLALVFGQPSRSFFASELIELYRIRSGAVQRELKLSPRAGWSLSPNRQAKSTTRPARLPGVRGAVRPGARRPSPWWNRSVRHSRPWPERISSGLGHGSVAKGTDTASSDIDLLVVADDMTLEGLLTLAEVESSLDRKISPTMYTKRVRRSAGSGQPILKPRA